MRRSHVLNVVSLRVRSPASVITQSRSIAVLRPPVAKPAVLPATMIRARTRATAQCCARAASSAGVRSLPGVAQTDLVALRSGTNSTDSSKKQHRQQ